MLLDSLRFLITNLCGFFALNLLLRFYLQVVRQPFNHPLAQFVLAMTNFAVLPLRKVLPSVGGYDSASLLLAWLTSLLMHVLVLLLSALPYNLFNPASAIALMLLAALDIMRLSVYLLFAAVLVQVVLSWVSPYNPLMPLLHKLTAPFLRPIQKALPPMGGIDLSPLLLILVIQLVLNVIFTSLEQSILRQLMLGG